MFRFLEVSHRKLMLLSTSRSGASRRRAAFAAVCECARGRVAKMIICGNDNRGRTLY